MAAASCSTGPTFTLVTLNMEYGNRNPDAGVHRGNLLRQSNPDVIFIQESSPRRVTLGPDYEHLDFSGTGATTKMDLSERMDVYVHRQSPWAVHRQFQIDTRPQKSPRQSKIVVVAATTEAHKDRSVVTSIFQNHPDAIWVKSSSLGKQRAYETIDFLSPNLSDHNGLRASFDIV